MHNYNSNFKKKGFDFMSQINYTELMSEFKKENRLQVNHFEIATKIAKVIDQTHSIEEAKRTLLNEKLSPVLSIATAKIVSLIHPQGQEFYEQFMHKSLSTREYIDILPQKLPLQAMMGYHNDKTMKEMLAHAITLTGSWIEFDKLKLLVPQSEIDKIDLTHDADPVFIFTENNEGKLQLETFFNFKRLPQIISLDVDTVKLEDMVSVIESAMSKHIQAGSFYKNDYLNGSQIQQLLRSTLISTNFYRENELKIANGIEFKPQIDKLFAVPFTNLTAEQTESLKLTATEVTKFYNHFDDAVKILIEANKNGDNVKIQFNGTNLYACEIKTPDDAYLKYMNMTKKEYDEKENRDRIEYEKREELKKAEAIKNMPQWIEQGKELILPQFEQEWAKTVESFINSPYSGGLVKDALTLMQMLKDGKPINEILEVFENQGHSGFSASMVESVLLNYTEKGHEFVLESRRDYLRPDILHTIEQKKAQIDILLGRTSTNDIKTYFLNALSTTQSSINKDDIVGLLPPDTLKQMDTLAYYVVQTPDGDFVLETPTGKLGEEILLPIEQIDLTNLAKLTKNAMQSHLNVYDRIGFPHDQTKTVLQRTVKTATSILEPPIKEKNVADGVLDNDTTLMPTSSNENPNIDTHENPDDR